MRLMYWLDSSCRITVVVLLVGRLGDSAWIALLLLIGRSLVRLELLLSLKMLVLLKLLLLGLKLLLIHSG